MSAKAKVKAIVPAECLSAPALIEGQVDEYRIVHAFEPRHLSKWKSTKKAAWKDALKRIKKNASNSAT